jgi:chitinase
MNKLTLYFSLVLVSVLAVGLAVSGASAAETPSIEVYSSTNGATPGPTMENATLTPTPVDRGNAVTISITASDVSGISTAIANVKNANGLILAIVQLYDDGKHSDGAVGDGVFANTWNVGNIVDGQYPIEIQLADSLGHPTVRAAALTIIVGTGFNNVNTYCFEHFCNSNSNVNAGNINNANNANNANANASDTTPPAIAITSPAADGTVLSTASYTVVANAIDTESFITKVEFYLDAETTPRDTQNFDQPAGSNNYAWVFNLTGVTAGNHTLKAITYNGVSLTATATRTVNVTYAGDMPTNVRVTSPLAGTFASTDTINAVIHAEDDVDITEIEVYSSAGGGPIGTASVTGASDTSVDRTISFTASSIAYVTGSTKVAAANWPKIRLPFISVAEAAVDQNCEIVTTPYSKSIYAIAYDASNSTLSGLVTYTINYTKTVCDVVVNANIPSKPQT